MKYGVHQGSCLEPLLFLIYINDISNTSNEGEFILFADDTNIFVRGQTALLAFKTANEILRKVNDYMHVNKLHINMEKCCFIHFKPGNNENAVTAEFDVKIGDKIIKQVSETKFLGITIDNKLSWDTHINKLSKKLSCATGILNRIKDNIPSELHKNLYHTLFESHLAYGITAWCGVSDKKLQSLFKVQKRCLRILFGDKETYLNKFKTCCRVRPYDHQKLENSFYEKEHSKPIFNEKFIMTVHNLYVYHCSNETLKIMKYRTPISMFNVFKTSNRKTTQMVTPIPDIQYVYNASITWNWARQVIKSNTDISDFSFSSADAKAILKNHILLTQKMGNSCEWNKYRDKLVLF